VTDSRRRSGQPPVFVAAAWGAGTVLVAYLLSFGSTLLFSANVVVIAVLVRLTARAILVRRGERPGRWWWL
jgi:hypothetical protein